jgi:hypothetical protein
VQQSFGLQSKLAVLSHVNAREHLAALLQQIRKRRLPDAAHLRSGAPGRMALSDFHVRFRTVTRHSETGTNGRETAISETGLARIHNRMVIE